MARWCSITLLLLVSLGRPGNILAQSAVETESGVVPAGWQSSGYVQTGQKAKVRHVGPMGPLPSGPGRTIYEELPDDQGWLYDDTRLERILKNSFRHAYFRVDYLNWSLTDPGNDLIGSGTNIIGFDQITSGGRFNDPATNTFAYPNGAGDPFIFQPYLNDPEIPFQVSNPATNNSSLISVVQPSMRDVDMSNNNGIRGTFGLPIGNIGAFEASIFSLETSSAAVTRPQILQFDVYDSNQNGIFGETFVPLAVGEFDRNGNGAQDDVVPNFEAFASAILVDMAIPTYGIVDTDDDPNVYTPQLPRINNPLSPGTELNPETADPNDTRVIPGRGDNFRIVWAYANPLNPAQMISDYRASLRTSVWGTDSSFLFNPIDQNTPLTIQPLMGFRYFSYRENFNQSGIYTYQEIDPRDQNNLLSTNSLRQINSATINNLYGPQFGMRAELKSKWLTLGVQPRAMLGLNSYEASLATDNVLRPDAAAVASQNATTAVERIVLQNLLRPDDVNQFLTRDTTTFGVMGDLEVYSRLRLTEYVSLNVGYNLLYAGMITRPYDNIIYNAKTVTTPNPNGTVNNRLDSDFKLDVNYTGTLLQGLNVGAEIRY